MQSLLSALALIKVNAVKVKKISTTLARRLWKFCTGSSHQEAKLTQTNPKDTNTLFLTGLRGYSALAVFFIHSGGGGLRSFGDWANKLVDLGKYGVISFFVLFFTDSGNEHWTCQKI
jgi:hypothetical protein